MTKQEIKNEIKRLQNLLSLHDQETIKLDSPHEFPTVQELSAESEERMTYEEALEYVGEMNKNREKGSKEWRLPNYEELKLFIDKSYSEKFIWTSTASHPTNPNWIFVRLSDGNWNGNSYFDSSYVRCVR
jgi:hypothetical protein